MIGAMVLTAVLAAAVPAQAAIPAAQRQALIDLYNATNGAGWTDSTGWLGAAGTECSWYGVTCDGGETTVTWLNLFNNNLVGPIPASIGNFGGLQQLWLHMNQLSGPIPTEVGDLANLQQLYLQGDALTGSIPSSLGGLGNLQELFLRGNQLTGTLPPSLGSLVSLQLFDLGSNQVSGAIPPELGNLASLVTLHLDVNQLTGPIPPSLGNLSNLQELWLQSNHVLGGPIPATLGNLSLLTDLNLGDNQLTGPIPPELGNLTQLTFLGLGNNQLSGALPSSIGNLVSLQRLFVNANQLVGLLPDSLLNLVNLQAGMLDLQYNGLWTANATLDAFLASKQTGGDWAGTQTIAPAGVGAAAASATSVTVSWTPIAYTVDAGGYRVSSATVPGGPYTFFARTGDKNAPSLDVTGLAPATTYYFIVEAQTDPHQNGGQQNTVTSEPSPEVSATTLTATPTPTPSWTPTPTPTPAPGPTIVTASPLPAGQFGTAYSMTFSATGGAPQYSWAVTGGAVPPGLALNATTGELSGTPTSVGHWTFTVQVTDIGGVHDSKVFDMDVTAQAEPIPTLSGPGTVALLILVGISAMVFVRRRLASH